MYRNNARVRGEITAVGLCCWLVLTFVDLVQYNLQPAVLQIGRSLVRFQIVSLDFLLS